MNRLIDFSSRFRILKGGKISLVVSAMLGSAIIASASPSGGTVTSGTATISSNGTVTNIDQSTAKATINWQTFSIATGETVNFNQPSSTSITLNRVIGNEKSIIDGALNANGQVWLLNSNGVLFSKNASINTSGILATTAELSDSDFNAGNYDFKNSSSNSVINQGTINVSNAGSVVLASNEVINEGTIKAVKGKVHLVGADFYSLNLNGNSLVNLKIDKGVLDALVKNSGHIVADGGEIYLTTNAVDELLKGVVNNAGIIEANSVDDLFGKVELFAHGGTAEVDGTIEALGGFVETSGDTVKIDDDFKVKADKWLIDPKDFTIASSDGDITGATLSSNLESASVEIQSVNGATDGDGDIFVNDTVSWDASTKLTLNASNDIFINKSITATTGQLSLKYGDNGDYYVNAQVNLSAGDNFFTKQTSGSETTWKVITELGNPWSNTGTDLQGINGNLSGNYVLGGDIDASDTSAWNVGDHDNDTQSEVIAMGFDQLGDGTTTFTGNFDGLGHNVDGLYINRPTENFVGLFGYTDDGTIIKNIGVTNVDVTGKGQTGGLIGKTFYSKVKNSYSTGKVVATWGYGGGLIGSDNYTTITNSYSSANVSGGILIGGLIGGQYGGTTTNSYSIGSVTGTGDNIGGLVGYSDGGTTKDSFWNTTTSGLTTSAKGTGKTTTQMQDINTFSDAGWSISEDSSLSSSYLYPVLVSENGVTTWKIYLDSTPVNYALSDISTGYTYKGSDYLLSSLWSASTIFGNTYSSWALGTDYNFMYDGNSVTGFTNAGTYSNISIDILKSGFSVADDDNTNGTFKIDKKDITAITGITVSDKIYDGLVSATLNTSNVAFTGIVENDTLSVATSTGEFDDKNVGTSKTVSISNLSLGGTDKDNYNLTSNPTLDSINANITKKDITVSGLTSENKVYDGTTTATVNGTAILQETQTAGSGTSDDGKAYTNDDVNLTGTAVGTFDDKDVLDATKVSFSGLSLNGDDKDNYNLINHDDGTFKIDKKDITAITGITVSDKIYDGLVSATLNTSNVAFIGIVENDTLSVATSTGKFDDKNVGTDKTVSISNLSLGGTDKDNYNLTSNPTLDSINANITKKDITVSGLTSENKVYDGTTTATVNGTAILQETQTAGSGTSDDGKAYTNDDVNLTGTAVGTFDDKDVLDATKVSFSGLSLNGDDKDNYNLINHDDGTYTITPRDITLVANKVSKTYGSSESKLTATVSSTAGLGLASNDVLEDIIGILSRESGETVGSYDVLLGNGEESSNYTISYNSDNNSYTITPSTTNLVNLISPTAPAQVIVNNNLNITSQPVQEEVATQVVTLSEIRTNQENSQTKEGSQTPQDVRVPLSKGSVIELVNGGVNLPEGVDQQFYVVSNDAN